MEVNWTVDNTSNQPSKFKTKNWVEINDESRGNYSTNSQSKFKTTLLKSSLCDYINTCYRIYTNNTNKKVLVKNDKITWKY